MTHFLLPKINLKKMMRNEDKDLCTRVFIIAFLVWKKKQKQSKCLTLEKKLNILHSIHEMKGCTQSLKIIFKDYIMT